MVNGLIQRKDVNMMMETKPKVKLSFENKWVDSFLGELYVDDCDQPPAPLLKIEMVAFDSIEVCFFLPLWTLHSQKYGSNLFCYFCCSFC